MKLSTLLLSGLLPASSFAVIQLRGFSGLDCEGDLVLDFDLPNVNQCNNFEDPPTIRSARASGLAGCIVTLYRTLNCDLGPGGMGAELFLDEDGVCEDAMPEFRVRSYEVQC